MRVTFDTNILVYAIDVDAGDKHETALDLIGRAVANDCVLTLQSLAEFFFVATRKGRLDPALATAFVEDWRAVFPVRAATEDTLVEAIAAVRRDKMSFWDAMLWAVAREAGCRIVVSEDFQDGQALGGVRFVNPFVPANDTLVEAALPPD